ncbi:hypothetical protein [uncultured Clostridium sp.]|uniref:hypothetical protein n=1 Tax=uncultured Clostridium sp. TaxID=59620 RepID=UPI00260CFD5B|nr:hypothetical protein [uncultured Clostridium sp.]
MKKNNEKSKGHLGKVSKIVATATMSAAILSPSVQSFAEPIQNKIPNKSQKEDQAQLAVKPTLSNLEITSSSPTITKTVSNGTTSDTQYKPENEVPKTGNIATQGTSFTYSVPITFQSNNGKSFNVNDIKFNTDINITGIDGAPLTAQQQQLANALKQSVVTAVESNHVKSTESSTGSFSVPISITLNDSCYGLQINPVFHMNYTVNGQEGTYTVKLKPILATRKYTETIAPTLTSTNNELGLQLAADNNGNASGELIGLDPVNLINGLNGKYMEETYTFKITPSDISTTKLVPIQSPYLKDNGNGTYTISGPLLQQAYAGTANLFKIEYPDQLIAGTVSITPENPKNLSNFNNGNEINSANTVYYTGNEINITHTPKPGTGTMLST